MTRSGLPPITLWVKRISHTRSHPLARRILRITLKYIGIVLLVVSLILFMTSAVQTECPNSGCKSTQNTRRTQSEDFIMKHETREWRNDNDTAGVKRILRWTGFFGDTSWEDTDDSYFTPCKVSWWTQAGGGNCVELFLFEAYHVVVILAHSLTTHSMSNEFTHSQDPLIQTLADSFINSLTHWLID